MAPVLEREPGGAVEFAHGLGNNDGAAIVVAQHHNRAADQAWLKGAHQLDQEIDAVDLTICY